MYFVRAVVSKAAKATKAIKIQVKLRLRLSVRQHL